MRDFKKYEVWQLAHENVLFVYKTILPKIPPSEKYDLTSRIKRAAYSIPLNIAEGAGRNTDKDFASFLDNALGSAQEVEYALLLIKELEFIDEDVYTLSNGKINIIKSKLINLIKSIRKP
ncbi:four helix bundle protein [Pedobacter sp. SD-b]|uniref:Four helix bundle protein n=1 Tax=Pedobacter segetis TaxID=2793069 RepID=A0ABS1BGP4_9SPHI|nr:four helix bundle protein [Pedobacter segetis]MBK0382040.1 four helix bundle protein [Pedobacter segetis]